MEQNVAFDVAGTKSKLNVYEIFDQKIADELTQPVRTLQGLRELYCSYAISTLALILALLAVIQAVALSFNSQICNCSCCPDSHDNGGHFATEVTMAEPGNTLQATTELSTADALTNNPLTTELSATEISAIGQLNMTEIVPAACGGPGWRRVAFLNMTNPNQNCPQGLNSTGYSIRSCGRSLTGGGTCSSVTFPVGGAQYSQVCGRVTAYHWGNNYAFFGYHTRSQNIDGYYVDGLSLTHGSPRTHIWTFASGLFNGSSGDSFSNLRCPCNSGNRHGSPLFIGNDYFCDSKATSTTWRSDGFRFYPDNALWDGQSSLNTCHSSNNPPWFRKTLPTLTSDNIELRMCLTDNSGVSDIGIEHLEIYVA